MSSITIGTTESGKAAKIDLSILLTSRLLIQANSGGGKSWAIRRLIEQAFGKIQQIVIDPEGEFPTLREKFGFVLVGPGGETPADVRSAAMVAEKLLELNASAVCDIYELKSAQRHAWVRTFLDAMINAPKKLWHPCLVIVDEAHVYCPEKGQGESEAIGAMTDLCTRGRKRGFCAVFATQRLGKLSKNASAELQNRMIGPTFEDIDRKRAADLLGVLHTDQRAFFHDIQLLEPGNFFALGRAIAIERIRLKVGPVLTTHPEVGSNRAALAPPAPESISKLLPQLVDLPKAAEEKARTEAEFRREISQLRAELKRAGTPQPTGITEAEVARQVAAAVEPYPKRNDELAPMAWAVRDHIQTIAPTFAALESEHKSLIAVLAKALPPAIKAAPGGIPGAARMPAPSSAAPAILSKVAARAPRMSPDEAGTNGQGLSRPQIAILAALGELEAIDRLPASRSWLAFIAGVSPVSSGFEKNVGTLRTRGYIEFPASGMVTLTGAGRQIQAAVEATRPMDSADLLNRVCRLLSGSQASLLRILHENYPKSLTRDELALVAGVSPLSSGFEKNVGTLRSRELAFFPAQGEIRAAEWLFL